MNLITLGESIHKIVPMLIYPLNQIGSDSNIKGSEASACEDVYAGMFLHSNEQDEFIGLCACGELPSMAWISASLPK